MQQDTHIPEKETAPADEAVLRNWENSEWFRRWLELIRGKAAVIPAH